MAIFDLFKRKTNEPPQKCLTLEDLLRKAATDPAFRAEFYKRLLTDELFVLTQDTHLPTGNYTLQQNTSVNLSTYPDGKIPVFTSTERIFDKGVIKTQVQYLAVKGADLFSFTKGATLLLNPYSDYGKELLPEEIAQLLNGTILTDHLQTMTVEKETRVQIGQPAIYPTEMVNALKRLFTERHAVKAAYLGWILNPESGEPPHYIFAIDTDTALQNLTQEAGFTAKQFLAEHEFVDFIKVDKKEGLSGYFLNHTKPFYERKS